jgi:hypothetical protein
MSWHRVTTGDRTVPEDSGEAIVDSSGKAPAVTQVAESRESIRVQALRSKIGAQVGMAIWIPRADRVGVPEEWRDGSQKMVFR